MRNQTCKTRTDLVDIHSGRKDNKNTIPLAGYSRTTCCTEQYCFCSVVIISGPEPQPAELTGAVFFVCLVGAVCLAVTLVVCSDAVAVATFKLVSLAGGGILWVWGVQGSRDAMRLIDWLVRFGQNSLVRIKKEMEVKD